MAGWTQRDLLCLTVREPPLRSSLRAEPRTHRDFRHLFRTLDELRERQGLWVQRKHGRA
jgi:hypothetical protein